MPYWFDPISFALVLFGSIVVTTLRCGWSEMRRAVGAALSLLRPPFDRVEAKAEMAKQVREIAVRWLACRRLDGYAWEES